MKSKHVYLNLFAIDFPITALASIVHRITGIFLFLFIPVLLYFFYLSIESNSSFLLAKAIISRYYVKILFYFFFFCFIYHFINGIKHIIMDFGFYDTKTASKNFTIVTLFFILFFVILSIIL